MNTVRTGAPRHKFRMAALALALLSVFAVSCGSDSEGGSATTTEAGGSSETTAAADPDSPGPAPKPLDEMTDVTIVMAFNIESFSPALLAKHFGEFEKENLNVTIQNVPSNEGSVMVAQNQAQLKVAGMSAAFYNAVNSGVDVVWLANVHQNSAESKEGVWMRDEFYDDKGEIIPEKLDGAKIAAGTGGIGSPSAFAINAFLEDNGASLDQIESPAIGGSDMLVAIEQGSLDGGYVLTPQWLSLEDGDVAQYAGMYGGFGGEGFSASAYEMSQTFIDDQPEVAAAIMRAIARTVATYLQGDYHADPEVLAALAEVTATPADSIASAPPLVFNPEMPINGEMVEDIQTMWIEYAPDTLAYKEPIPVDKLVNRDLIEQVLAGK
jgi:NitT/TauT family transport system substrate-binding protein